MKEGKIVEQGRSSACSRRPQHPYTRELLAAEPKPDPAPLQPERRRGRDQGSQGLVPDQARRAAQGRRPHQGGRRRRLAVRQGETLGIVGESGSGKTTLGLAILRLISSDGPIVFLGKTDRRAKFKRDAAVPPRHADRVPGPYGSLVPRMSVVRHHRGRSVGAPSEADRERARSSASSARCAMSASIPRPASAIRTNSPAASASASRSRARSCWSRPSSCSTSRPARSTCRPGADRRPAARPAEAAQSHLPVHLPRPAGGGGAGERLIVMRDGKVVEDGPAADLFADPEDRLHARAVRRGLQSRSRARRRGRAIDRACRNVAILHVQRVPSCLPSSAGTAGLGSELARARPAARPPDVAGARRHPADVAYACVWQPPHGKLADYPQS